MPRKRFFVVVVSVVLTVTNAFSQQQQNLFELAFEEFMPSRLWAYEEIEISWTMDGMIQADLNDGINYLAEGKPALAEASLTTVLEKDAHVWEALYYRAAAHKQLNQFKQARQDLEAALEIKKDLYEAHIELAKLHHLRFNLTESEKAINKAIRLDKTRGTAYYLKGDIRLLQRDKNAAIRFYKECLEADSLFHDARIKLALLDLLLKKNVPAAITHLTRVIEYDSLQRTALLFRGILEADRKQYEAAYQDLSRLVRVSPTNTMALYYRGVVATKVGRYRQAFKDFQEVVKATATDDNNFKGQQTWIDKKIDLQNAGTYTIFRVYGLGDDDGLKVREAYCHILTQDFDKGLAALDLVSNGDKEPLVVYLRAVALEHKGEHIKALQHYSKALALDNDIADAHKKRGIYAQELKQWDLSVKDFSDVLRLDPHAFVTYKMRGVSYYHNGEYVKALADYNAYLQHDSANAEVTGYRGMAYLKTGERMKAYVDFVESGNPQGLDFADMEKLVDSALHAGDTTQALNFLDKILEQVPAFTEGYVQKFRIQVARDAWKAIDEKILDALRHRRLDSRPGVHSYLLTIRAMSLVRLRHREDALAIFDEAIRTDKGNGKAYLERGRFLLEDGKKSKAQKDLERASVLGEREAGAILATLR